MTKYSLVHVYLLSLAARPPGIPVLKVKYSPPLSVKIPENFRYENTTYTSRM